jgi:hypothetical protein
MTAGIPQIADNFLGQPSRQPWATSGLVHRSKTRRYIEADRLRGPHGSISQSSLFKAARLCSSQRRSAGGGDGARTAS